MAAMRVISKKKLREFWEKHPEAEEPLMHWYRVAMKANWNNLAETRSDFPHAKESWKGDGYRLSSQVSELLSGKRLPSKTQRQKLGEFFGVSPDLFRADEEKE